MTREDAIICLKGIKNYGRDTFNEQTDWQGCLDMAIEALTTLDEIKSIIISPLYIQEDVFRYKMVCGAMEKYLYGGEQ